MSGTNLYRVIDITDWASNEAEEQVQIGDLVTVDEYSACPFITYGNDIESCMYDWRLEQVVDHESCFIESFNSDGKIIKDVEKEEPYVFTFGERMCLPHEGSQGFYYVGTHPDGAISFSREPLLGQVRFEALSHGCEVMNNFKPYVEPLVLTQSELDEAFGCPVQVV